MDFTKIRNALFIALLTGITIVFFWMIKEFAYPIFWAGILAAMFYPVYKKLNKKIKIPNLATAITLILIILIIIIPLASTTSLVLKESVDLYTQFTSNKEELTQNLTNATDWLKNNPHLSSLNINDEVIVDKLSEIGKSFSSFLVSSIKKITQNTIIFTIMTFISFYALFFFIRDGEKLLKKLMYLSPLGSKNEKLLFEKFISTTRATLKGSIIIGLIQGSLGGLMFAVVGIKGAIIWGILMVLLASIPAIGTYFIWLPAAIIMIIIGKVYTGIAMLLFGSLIIGTIDNFIRPILVGRDTQMHPLLVLLSTLGGIVVFGITGFVIGPIITSLMLAFWEMYEANYKKNLDEN